MDMSAKAERTSIAIRQTDLVGCKKCSNRDTRDENSENGICSYNRSSLDALPIRCVGDWANDKIYYLVQYFGIFANGMKNKWDGNLRYIELCSGPGRCSTRDGHEQDGTALAIVNHNAFQYLADAIFIDYNNLAVETLTKRIVNLGQSNKARAILGDYNDHHSILNAMSARYFKGLTLCLIDPTDCSIPFTTLENILSASNGKCDFIISFFDKTDFHRNAVEATLEPSYVKLRRKYERFLGNDSFFQLPEVIDAAKLRNNAKLSELFRTAYGQRLSQCGLTFQNTVPIGRFYHLLFASSNTIGYNFWMKSRKYDPNGQQEFNF